MALRLASAFCALGSSRRVHTPTCTFELAYCQRDGIAFIPWFPVAAGKLAQPGGKLDGAAKRHGATVSQLSLAWLLHRSPVMLPIPGTSSVAHLEENIAAVSVKLSNAEWKEIEDSAV